eukprot:5171400-Amphidinium_carterae.2
MSVRTRQWGLPHFDAGGGLTWLSESARDHMPRSEVWNFPNSTKIFESFSNQPKTICNSFGLHGVKQSGVRRANIIFSTFPAPWTLQRLSMTLLRLCCARQHQLVVRELAF